MLTNLRRSLPYNGQTVVRGHLRSMGYYITRIRVRESIRRTDPLNTALRWGGDAHRRRPYSVPGPNSLWHLGKNVDPRIIHMYVAIYHSVSVYLSSYNACIYMYIHAVILHTVHDYGCILYMYVCGCGWVSRWT